MTLTTRTGLFLWIVGLTPHVASAQPAPAPRPAATAPARSYEPTRVTLRLDDVPAERALEAVGAQARVQLRPSTTEGYRLMAERRVTLRAENRTLLMVLKDIARQTGSELDVGPSYFGSERTFQFTHRPAPAAPGVPIEVP